LNSARCDCSLTQGAGVARGGRSLVLAATFFTPPSLILRATRQGDRTVKIQYKSRLQTAQLLFLTGNSNYHVRTRNRANSAFCRYFRAMQVHVDLLNTLIANRTVQLGNFPNLSGEARSTVSRWR